MGVETIFTQKFVELYNKLQRNGKYKIKHDILK